jgi:hypothetical protein
MGPANSLDIPESLNGLTLSLPKLLANSSNWSTYQEHILNAITSKGLKRHVMGNARKLADLTEINGEYYKPRALTPLEDDQLEKHEEAQDLYEQNQVTVHEIIYQTVNRSTFLQIKEEKMADSVWKKLISIHANKGGMYETELLVKLQNIRYTEGSDMREHLAQMIEIRERLAEMNVSLSEKLFDVYIRTLLSLTPTFQPLLIALNAAAQSIVHIW